MNKANTNARVTELDGRSDTIVPPVQIKSSLPRLRQKVRRGAASGGLHFIFDSCGNEAYCASAKAAKRNPFCAGACPGAGKELRLIATAGVFGYNTAV